MKQLLTMLLVCGISISSILSQKWLPSHHETPDNPVDSIHSRGVLDRNDFPVLYVDSIYEEFWDFGSNEIAGKNFQKYRYNAQHKVIQADLKNTASPNFMGFWQRTAYELNDQGQTISYLTVNDDNGLITLSRKSDFVYDTENRLVSRTSYTWDQSWKSSSRTLYEYPDDTTRVQTTQKFENGVWINMNRITTRRNSLGLLTRSLIEAWNEVTFEWESTHEALLEYDVSNNITLRLAGTGNPTVWNNKLEYLYDTLGRNYLRNRYLRDSESDAWALNSRLIYVYNIENQLIEQSMQEIDSAGVLMPATRQNYTYGEGFFDSKTTEILSQVWNIENQVFMDHYRNTYEYSEPSEHQIHLLHTYQFRPNLNVPDWYFIRTAEYFYHFDDEVSSPEPQALKPCQAPNPYPTNHKVTCNGLQENGSYMLYVYDTQGRVAYARHFKGGDGWSIHQNLPVGVYIAAIVRNGERISAQRLVIGQ